MAKGGRGTAFPVPTAVEARISRLTWAGWLTARSCAIMPPIDHPSTAGRRSPSAEIRALAWLVMAVTLSEAGAATAEVRPTPALSKTTTS